MSKRSDDLLVADICEAGEKILRYTAGMDEAAFIAHELTVDAVIRNIEIMGEAASILSDEFKQTHAETPFRQMTALRNRVIHGYFGVSLPIIWRVVRDDLPLLLKQFKNV